MGYICELRVLRVTPMADKKPDHARIRKYSRHKLDVQITASAAREGGELKLTGKASDLGMGGLTAQVPADLAIGEEVTLEFTLPYSQRTVKLGAKVRNRSGSRYGLEFLSLDEEQRAAIQRLCDMLTLLEG